MKKNIAGKISDNQASSTSGRMSASNQDHLDEIITGCRERNVYSQEQLYKKFYGYAMGVALTYCTSRADAVEVVNDSFMKVFKNIKTYDLTRPFKPWFRKIVVNTSIDKARANKRFQNQVQLEDIRPSSASDVEAHLNVKQIYKLLNELPDLLRFVFNMYEIEGYSHREIADKLDIAESSARTYLTRAKAQLRDLYKKLYRDEI